MHEHKVTDSVFKYIQDHCKHLRILALTKTTNMNGEKLSILLQNSLITTLDFNLFTDIFDSSTITGIITQEFLTHILGTRNHISTLNLYGQSLLSSEFIQSIPFAIPTLISLCVDQIPITDECFTAISATQVKRLSIIGTGVSGSIIKKALQEPNLDRLYCGDDIGDDKVVCGSGWFVDEQLDLFSLWNRSVNQYNFKS